VTPAKDETVRVREYWNKFAPKYDREMGRFERVLFQGGREWACSQAEGEVLEIAVGTGRNLPHYPAGARVTGIEFSPAMLDLACARAAQVMPTADLRLGDAQRLEFPDDSFDTVVCTMSLCSIPDDSAAVAEMKRVLRPGGKLVLLEHVRSPLLVVRLIQRLLDLITVRVQHDHLCREPLDRLRESGLEVDSLERSKLGIIERVVAHKRA
jgi:ubiquinone/menaquinone biosynthesis C-methylase UbiE